MSRAKQACRRRCAKPTAFWASSNVKVIHANDSKTPLGSHVDRHENIGEGHIGADGFRRILTHPKLREKPFILETPVDNEGDDRRNVETLKRLWQAQTRRAPHASSEAGRQVRSFQKIRLLKEICVRTATFVNIVKSPLNMPEKSYDHNQIELKWYERWTDDELYKAEENSTAPEVLRARDAALSERARCTSGTCATTRSATRWRATSGCAASTCCIPWAGTRSACRPRTPPSPTSGHPREWTLLEHRRDEGQHRRFAFSYDWDLRSHHLRAGILSLEPVVLSARCWSAAWRIARRRW